MHISDTSRSLAASDMKVVAKLMAKDPEFAKELVDAISEKLDEKFGWMQGHMNDRLDEISKKLDRSIEENTRRFDSLDSGIADLRAGHELHDGYFRKVNKRLDSIDGHLDINTDTRRRA